MEFGFDVRQANIDDAVELFHIECICFPPDEAASLDSIKFRISNAGVFFQVLRFNGRLIGFINGTCSSHDKIHHESMTNHNSNGHVLIIHSGLCEIYVKFIVMICIFSFCITGI